MADDVREPSKQTPSHPNDGEASYNRARRAAMASKFAAVDRAKALRQEIPEPDKPFTPCHIFFYGSLMSPQVLQTVAKLENTPLTQKGIVKGFKIKMWGIYPAAIPCSDTVDTVAGTVWHVDEYSQLARLQEYETGAYKLYECEIEVEGGEKLSGSKMFCWAGEHDSPELEEGVFDFERYQKYFMPSVIAAGTQ
ncbi:hypothetical protein KVR01_013184 [Diaporthe batatas]|uniref:uncharacterized protein n=1 Tax=Diaporthe batatas TaxID=748121 RepID=UPI001D051E18|nr:uncharacterized protein KVR01_013184 [Diaporthe batatas]KAG8156962.1 hypothetical protein KVR01_013184 [Diaporthe batatas]